MTDYKISRKLGKAATLPTSPAYTFASRYDRMPSDPGPGPGAYGPGISMDKKGTGFGSSTRYTTPSAATPSGLDYQPSIKQTNQAKPSYTFGTKLQPEHLKNKVPGPGHYDATPDKLKPNAPAHSISARPLPSKESERRPGPNEYAPDYKVKETAAASIKFRHETSGSGPAGPGPGAYDVDKVRASSAGKTFGVSRSYRHLDNGVPGPGEYAPKDTRRCQSVSMGRTDAATLQQVYGPGPGQYINDPVIPRDHGHDAASQHKSAPAFTFAGKVFYSTPPANPGPGDYGCPKDPARRSNPQFTFKGVTVKDPKARIPGPGAYDWQRGDSLVRSSAPCISLSLKMDVPGSKDRKPAPGEYSIKVDHKPGVSMKFRHDIKADNSQNPAPHDYADKDFNSHMGTYGGSQKGFTMGKRWRTSEREGVPGPHYQTGVSTLGIAGSPEVVKSKIDLSVVL